jgi:hypothetical protein
VAEDRVVFLRPDAERIAQVVRAVENGNRDESPLTFRRPGELPLKVIRTATFTSAWTVGEIKTVTFKNVTATPNTTRVGNLTFDFFPIGTATSFDCVIGKVTGPSKITAVNETASWVLVSAEVKENSFRVCTFTGEWSVNSAKVVTFTNQASTPNTVSAINLIADVPAPCTPGTASRDVLVAKEGTAWYYVRHESECDGRYPAKELDDGADCGSSLSGISGGDGAQVLLNESGCAKWLKLARIEVVTDVTWNNGIFVQKQFIWAFRDPSQGNGVQIIGATACP